MKFYETMQMQEKAVEAARELVKVFGEHKIERYLFEAERRVFEKLADLTKALPQ